MCRLCSDKDFRIGLQKRTKTLVHFDITPSGNSVMTPCGRTITWQSFRHHVVKDPRLPTSGITEITKWTRSILNEQGISLGTPQKSSPQLKTSVLKAVKNLSSGNPAGDLPSVLPLHSQLLIDIARALGKSSWRREVTSREVYELHRKCIQSLRTYSQPSGRSLESHCSIVSAFIIQDIKNSTTNRSTRHGNQR